MIQFAILDEQGVPVSGGTRHVLPDGAVELPGAYSLKDLSRLRYVKGAWEERTDIAPQVVRQMSAEDEALWQAVMLDRARAEAVARINAGIADLRRLYFTDITGQDAVYLEKRAEAVAYVAQVNHGGPPETLTDYPLLDSEVGVTAPDPWQLAQLWLNRADLFKRIAAATEGHRLRAVNAIAAARDHNRIDNIVQDFNQALNGLSI
ncbi:MAG: hypothetical protein MUE83_11200 [Tabrizicola sp.]|jgi:hypothetical protein|nr:hypothetical protein [Tabrizicola sp.]